MLYFNQKKIIQNLYKLKRLQDANDIPQTQGMTQQTINNYNDKQREAERALTSAQE